ncbi:myosin-like coiled-coil protein-domain-containing protein [Cladochytrium replicatum]|nr:myosin-like coiled-coil protein-domain-containing protein [Cladochytrium replicatum]
MAHNFLKPAKSDLVKTQNQKQKIETLCRELQKENKRIKEESKRLAITEQQKREELSSKFESTIGEIKNKMEEDSDEKRRRAEDNELLKEKFKEFLEQYDIRERHFQSAMQNKDLEVQLREAKLEQQRQISEQEALRNAAFKSQIASFIATETELRRQLAIYVEKFKQVEETLNRSNELFMTFRREMEEMTKKTKRLEKENAAAKVKFEKMNRNILEMAEECKKVQKSLDIANGTKAKLENLCRALQAERKKTQASADGKSPTPAAPPPPPPPNIVPNGTAPPPQSAGRGAKVTKSDQMKPPSSVVSNAQQNHSPVGNSGPPVSERRSIGTNTILTASTAFRTATLRDSASSSVIPQVDPSTGEFVTKGGKKRVVPNAQQGGGGSKVSDRASENKRRRGIGGHGVMSSGEESSDEGVRVKRSVNPEGNGEDEEEGLDGHYPATTEDEPDDDEDDDELYSDAAEDV